MSVVLALGCWALVGWLNQRHYYRSDWTASRAYSLSDKTIMILKDLNKPLTITTLLRPGTHLERNAKDMLGEYVAHSKLVTVVPIDPDRDAAKVEMLAKRLKLDSFQLNSVLFEFEGKTKQVTGAEMEEKEPGESPFVPSKKPPKFKGEEAFTSAILNLTEGKAPVVYFTAGHGEKDPSGSNPEGISEIVKVLQRENYQVSKLVTLTQGAVPANADVVAIISPRQKFLSQEVDAIGAYLISGGKLLVLLDPMTETGLEPLLKSWGVEVDNDVVLDPVRRVFFAGPTTLVVGDFGFHPLVRKLKGSAVLFSLARSMRPVQGATGAEALMNTSKEAWGETDLQKQQAQYDKGVDLEGPLSLGVAVDRKSQGGARLVVFGDSDFLTNAQWSNARNMDLFVNAVNWLASRENLISIGPKSSDVRQAVLTAPQMQMIFWFTVLGMPMAGVVAGSTVRFRRRK